MVLKKDRFLFLNYLNALKILMVLKLYIYIYIYKTRIIFRTLMVLKKVLNINMNILMEHLNYMVLILYYYFLKHSFYLFWFIIIGVDFGVKCDLDMFSRDLPVIAVVWRFLIGSTTQRWADYISLAAVQVTLKTFVNTSWINMVLD